MEVTKITTISRLDDETLSQVLTHIQRMWIPNKFFFMTSDWDWFVVLQCLQDYGQFNQTPVRPPLAKFEQWVRELGVPMQWNAQCSGYGMSIASRKFNGVRYPWTSGTKWAPLYLERWRAMYDTLAYLISCEQMQHEK